MGRLRDDYETPLLRSVAEEVTDLFGVEDAMLFRFVAVDQTPHTDPLWGEPTTTPKYKGYAIQLSYLDPDAEQEASEAGGFQIWNRKIYISVNHLLRAGVPLDSSNDWVAEGDVVQLFTKSGEPDYIFDIVVCERAGWVNDTDKFTGYELEVRRSDKYHPERKTKP